jgi:hypothetical protein
LYGDVFHSTQAHQHAYECIQPLQGFITFAGDDDNTVLHHYRNNVSLAGGDRQEAKQPGFWSIDSLIYVMLVTIVGLAWGMLGEIENQTTYNDLYLTYFKVGADYLTYTVEAAGKTNALYCMLIAMHLVVFSVLIGRTSSNLYSLSWYHSCLLVIFLMILQVVAIGIHITMLILQNPKLSHYCLTTVSMLVLHVLTLILSMLGLGLLMSAPQSTIAANSKELTYKDIQRETTGNFYLCVIEDLNAILCYAFIVLACDAQSFIQDDSTLFFDVLCVVFVGFLQHVTNVLMIFHAHIDKHTKLEKAKAGTNQAQMTTQCTELLNFIARTRVFLYFMITASCVVGTSRTELQCIR